MQHIQTQKGCYIELHPHVGLIKHQYRQQLLLFSCSGLKVTREGTLATFSRFTNTVMDPPSMACAFYLSILPVQILSVLLVPWALYSLASKHTDFHNHRSPRSASLPGTPANPGHPTCPRSSLRFLSQPNTHRLTSGLEKIQKLTQPAPGPWAETNGLSPAARAQPLTHLTLPQFPQQMTLGTNPIPNPVTGSGPPSTAVFSTETLLPPLDDRELTPWIS